MVSTHTPSASGSAQCDHDSPWKEALERFFPEFLALLFPAIHAEIDWRAPYRSLDRELQQITGDADSGRRYADKLLDVRTCDGHETWVLVHVEVQGDAQAVFPQRMFQYNYRIRDRYDRAVVSLAVLSDNNRCVTRMGVGAVGSCSSSPWSSCSTSTSRSAGRRWKRATTSSPWW